MINIATFFSVIVHLTTSHEVDTVETGKKEPVFIRTLRLKFNLLNPLNKNQLEAETGRGYYMARFMCSEFLRIFKNSYNLIRILQ